MLTTSSIAGSWRLGHSVMSSGKSSVSVRLVTTVLSEHFVEQWNLNREPQCSNKLSWNSKRVRSVLLELDLMSREAQEGTSMRTTETMMDEDEDVGVVVMEALVAGEEVIFAMMAGEEVIFAMVVGEEVIFAMVAEEEVIFAVVAGEEVIFAVVAEEEVIFVVVGALVVTGVVVGVAIGVVIEVAIGVAEEKVATEDINECATFEQLTTNINTIAN